ncbi:MAG: hypothetical protein AABW99_00685 [archaeon]
MVHTKSGQGGFSLEFSAKEASELGLSADKGYELTKARKGVWVLAETGEGKKEPEKPKITAEKSKIDEAEQKIIGYLKQWPLKERVEGVFEAKLPQQEKAKLEELLKNGKIEKFKLNESYKKAVYRLSGDRKNFDNKERSIQDYSLENDGFLVVKNELRAKELSEQLKDSIKEGKVRGTRSFTGEFFIISMDLLNATQQKILAKMKSGPDTELEKLSKETGLTPTLVRIAMEFLKEDGQIIEKRRDHYQYID